MIPYPPTLNIADNIRVMIINRLNFYSDQRRTAYSLGISPDALTKRLKKEGIVKDPKTKQYLSIKYKNYGKPNY